MAEEDRDEELVGGVCLAAGTLKLNTRDDFLRGGGEESRSWKDDDEHSIDVLYLLADLAGGVVGRDGDWRLRAGGGGVTQPVRPEYEEEEEEEEEKTEEGEREDEDEDVKIELNMRALEGSWGGVVLETARPPNGEKRSLLTGECKESRNSRNPRFGECRASTGDCSPDERSLLADKLAGLSSILSVTLSATLGAAEGEKENNWGRM